MRMSTRTKYERTFYFKGCTKCRGDLYLDSDAYGPFLKCLQCGRITDVASTDAMLAEPIVRESQLLAA